MASQITGVPIVCSTVCLDVEQRKHQCFALLAYEWYPPVDSPHKGLITQRMFPLDDVITLGIKFCGSYKAYGIYVSELSSRLMAATQYSYCTIFQFYIVVTSEHGLLAVWCLFGASFVTTWVGRRISGVPLRNGFRSVQILLYSKHRTRSLYLFDIAVPNYNIVRFYADKGSKKK